MFSLGQGQQTYGMCAKVGTTQNIFGIVLIDVLNQNTVTLHKMHGFILDEQSIVSIPLIRK